MNIKEIRETTGMTQKAFADCYQIPLQTIKQWESDTNSTSYRKPPEYVVNMLSVMVSDYKVEKYKPISNNKQNHLIRAAIDSKNDINLWFRYLRKEFSKGKMITNKKVAKEALTSDSLSMLQKVCLKQALDSSSMTAQYINNLNQKSNATMLNQIIRKHANV